MMLKTILSLTAAFGALSASADLWMAGDSTMCNYTAHLNADGHALMLGKVEPFFLGL